MRLYVFLLFFLSSVSITTHTRNTSFTDKTTQVCSVCNQQLTYQELSLSISLSLITVKNIHICSTCRKNKKRGLFFRESSNQTPNSPLQRNDSYCRAVTQNTEKYSKIDIMRTLFRGLIFSMRRGSDLLDISDENEKHLLYKRAPRQIIEMKEIDGQLVFVGSNGEVFSYDTEDGFDEWDFTKKEKKEEPVYDTIQNEPLYETIEDIRAVIKRTKTVLGAPSVPPRPSRDNPPLLPPRNDPEKREPLYEIPVIYNLDGSQSSWV